jgi:hypothetical protein
MAAKFQVTFDCADPGLLVRFWVTALHYQVEDPPPGFASWKAYWQSIGVPPDELTDVTDDAESIVDPSGQGPRIWFQQVPEAKVVKNRLHLDLDASGG